MTRSRLIIGLVVIGVFVVIPMLVRLQQPTYYHADFVKNAELFKRRFLDRVPLGSPRSRVWDYLESIHAQVHLYPTGPPRAETDSVEYWIPLSTESHVFWYCGATEVGVLLVLTTGRLASAETQSRGRGCL
jgi:hypothetical protein